MVPYYQDAVHSGSINQRRPPCAAMLPSLEQVPVLHEQSANEQATHDGRNLGTASCLLTFFDSKPRPRNRKRESRANQTSTLALFVLDGPCKEGRGLAPDLQPCPPLVQPVAVAHSTLPNIASPPAPNVETASRKTSSTPTFVKRRPKQRGGTQQSFSRRSVEARGVP